MDVGLHVLYRPEGDPLADIVFVHGLQGHLRKTWTARKGIDGPATSKVQKPRFWQVSARKKSLARPTATSDQSTNNTGDVYWPQDLLPQDCPRCQISTFGYDSHVTKFFSGAANQSSIFGHSRNLLYALARSRTDCQSRPIIFVAHSLGGILVKEVLRRAGGDEDTEIMSVQAATKAIFFLGTPHRGSNMAPLGETIRKIVAITGVDTNSKNIRALHFDSTELEISREEFMRKWRQGSFIVRTFQEGQGFKGYFGINGKVVMDMSSSLDDPREHAEYINANHVNMCRFTGRDDPGYQQVGGELRKIVNTIQRNEQELDERKIEVQLAEVEKEGMLSSDEQECLRSIFVPKVDMWEYDIDADLQNTCSWLLNMPEYRSWEDVSNKDKKHTLLWIKGKPGAGKSTSLRTVLSKLRSNRAHSKSIKLTFSFSNNGSSSERTILGLFKTLIFQLCQQSQHIFQRFLNIFRRKAVLNKDDWEWSEEELKRFFSNTMEEFSSSSSYIFIDALDECEHPRELVGFLESIRRRILQGHNCMRLCYSSRYHPHIKVQEHTELHVDKLNSADVEKYIDMRLEPMIQRRHITRLKQFIMDKAQGVFLWVVLIVNNIIEANDNGESMKGLEQMLEDIPDELGGLYRKILQKIKKENPAETLLILQCILCATRPLTLSELRYALSFQNTKYESQAQAEDCLSFIETDQQLELYQRARTGGLTEARTHTIVDTDYARQLVDRDSQTTVHIIHESANNFLLKHGGLELLASVPAQKTLRNGQYQLAEICINYLSTVELKAIVDSSPEPDSLGPTKSVELLERLYRLHPLLQYSLQSVFKHIKGAECDQGSEETQQTYLYERMEHIFPVWRYFWDLDCRSRFHETHGTRATLVHLAVEHNIDRWLKYYLTSGGDVNLNGGRLGTLLTTSIVMGHIDMVKFLLDHGADCKISEGRFGTALSAAAWQGNLAIVKTLINQGSDINDINGDLGSPLHAAACSKNASVELIHMLLQAGADIQMKEGRHGTALQAAAYEGKADIVRTLIKCGADINAVCGENGTAIAAAASRGHGDVVQILLKHGADPTIEAGDCGNTIWAAAYNDHEQVVCQILKFQWPSWEPNRVEEEAQKILSAALRTRQFHEAVANGDYATTKKALQNGVDANAKGAEFSSALHTAAIYGHDELVSLLINQEQIRLDVGDSRGRTPLWQAASNGHTEIVRNLIETGQVDCRCKTLSSGRNLLWYPASQGYMDIVRMLFEAGADPYEADDDGITPFMEAEEEEQGDVIRFFKDCASSI